jgi:hypothetical protein
MSYFYFFTGSKKNFSRRQTAVEEDIYGTVVGKSRNWGEFDAQLHL